MIVNIAPIASAQPMSYPVTARARAHVPVSSLGPAAWDGAVHVDMIPSSPPPEVHGAIGVAAQSYQRLHASGHLIGFAIDQTTGKVVIEVRDTQGTLLWTAPPSKALEIAGGAALD
jgi:hypothetical protein